MDANPPRIEIFTPFGEAYELMKQILFKPFDPVKWLVIGFAAWLATFFSGGSFNFQGFGKQNWNWKGQYHGPKITTHEMAPWAIALLVGVGILILVIFILLVWLNARGRFMFVDCIVRNRGAIVEPWCEYRREGNRYFALQLIICLCSIVLFGGLALLFILAEKFGRPIVPVAILILLGIALILVAIVIGLIIHFIVPVMYRQRCAVGSAFRQVCELIVRNPGVFILFLLFYLVIYIAAAMIGCLVGCVTCCIAVLPYVGTVILLPVVTVLYAFPLCFLRQFGDQYDVFVVARPAEIASGESLPPAIPPVQEPPSTPPPPPPAPPQA